MVQIPRPNGSTDPIDSWTPDPWPLNSPVQDDVKTQLFTCTCDYCLNVLVNRHTMFIMI